MRRFATKFTAAMMSAVMVLSLAGCGNKETPEQKAQREFSEYCDQLFIDSLNDDAMSIHYTVADYEKCGIKLDKVSLGEITEEEIKKNEDELSQELEKLKAFDSSLLTERQQLSLRILISYFEKQQAYNGYSMMENIFGMNTGYIANLPTNFIEFMFDSEDDVKMYLELLKDVQRYTGQVLDYVKLQAENGYFMTDYCVDQNIDMIEQYFDADINPLTASFEEKIAALDMSDDKKKEYIAQNEQYVVDYYDTSYELIEDTLEELRGSCQNDEGLCNYEGGDAYYAAIVADKTSTSMTPEDVGDYLDEAMSDLFTQYSALYYADTSLEEQCQNVDYGMSDPTEILTFLANSVSNEFPEPYTKNFVVQYQSKATEVEGTLAYYLTARLDRLDYNSIKVNGSAFEEYGEARLFTTLAHEGYPGHLYQFTSVYSNAEIPNVCKILNFIGFTEGWAEYASDRAIVLSGHSEELAEMITLNDMYGYILQSRMDIGVNYEGWDREEAAAYCEYYGIDKDTSDEIYESCISDPGLLLPYTVGHIKMRDLRSKVERKLGDSFDSIEYNKLIMDMGLVDFDIMADEVNKYIDTKKSK